MQTKLWYRLCCVAAQWVVNRFHDCSDVRTLVLWWIFDSHIQNMSVEDYVDLLSDLCYMREKPAAKFWCTLLEHLWYCVLLLHYISDMYVTATVCSYSDYRLLKTKLKPWLWTMTYSLKMYKAIQNKTCIMYEYNVGPLSSLSILCVCVYILFLVFTS